MIVVSLRGITPVGKQRLSRYEVLSGAKGRASSDDVMYCNVIEVFMRPSGYPLVRRCGHVSGIMWEEPYRLSMQTRSESEILMLMRNCLAGCVVINTTIWSEGTMRLGFFPSLAAIFGLRKAM